ncbi:MAG: transcription elongation factor Spt5 [Candidatus Nanohaloarchaea archaeon]
MILTGKTTRGREKNVIDSIRSKVKSANMEIKAVFSPKDLKGYIFIEGDEAAIRELPSEIRNLRGVIDEEVDVEEIEKYLDEEEEEIKIEEGDEVEVIGGAFKGEEAKVKRLDETNHEVTIELIDAAVPIPTTVDIDTVRKKASTN